MFTKKKVLKVLNTLPNEFSLDELVEKLIIVERVEIGLQQVEKGKKLTDIEAKKKLSTWLI